MVLNGLPPTTFVAVVAHRSRDPRQTSVVIHRLRGDRVGCGGSAAGTGRFENAGGAINSEGLSIIRDEASGTYDDTATLSGELVYTASDRGRGKGK